MIMRCEQAKGLLERFHDQELRGRKLRALSEHLRQCENCSNELERLDQIGRMLKEHFEERILSENLSHLSDRVLAAVETPAVPEPRSPLDQLISIFSLPKPAWAAVGVAAIVLVFALAYLPAGHGPTLAANDCIIDNVDAEDCSVMVYEVGDTKMKVIWVMEQGLESDEEEGVTS